MVNVKLLKAELKAHHVTLRQAAEAIGVNPSTLYRRFCKTDVPFSVGEVDKLATLLSMDYETVQSIFFGGRFA